MKTLARVGVLEQVSAVKIGQPVSVGREVRWYPVQNHADAVLVQIVHQVHEVLRRAVAGGGRKISRGLVSPRTVERMLHDGQQFHVGKIHLAYIFRQARSGLAVGQGPIALFRNPHPGTKVYFIDGNRSLQGTLPGAGFHPRLVGPLVVEIPHHRRGAWRLLVQHAKGIGFVADVSLVVGNDVILVQRALADSRQKSFPDAGIVPGLQGMRLSVPAVEISDDGN